MMDMYALLMGGSGGGGSSLDDIADALISITVADDNGNTVVSSYKIDKGDLGTIYNKIKNGGYVLMWARVIGEYDGEIYINQGPLFDISADANTPNVVYFSGGQWYYTWSADGIVI